MWGQRKCSACRVANLYLKASMSTAKYACPTKVGLDESKVMSTTRIVDLLGFIDIGCCERHEKVARINCLTYCIQQTRYVSVFGWALQRARQINPFILI